MRPWLRRTIPDRRCAPSGMTWLLTPRRQRLLLDGGQRRRWLDRLRVDEAVQDRGLTRSKRALERRRELLRPLHALAVAAEGARVGGEIGVLQHRRRDAPGVLPLLVHANGAVHAVVEEHDGDGEFVLHGGRQILAVHQEVAVARE